MEHIVSSFPDGDQWDIAKMFSTEELDFTSELIGQLHFTDGCGFNPEATIASIGHVAGDSEMQSSFYYWNMVDSKLNNCDTNQEMQHTAGYFPDSTTNVALSVDLCLVEQNSTAGSVLSSPEVVMNKTDRCIRKDVIENCDNSPEANVPTKEMQHKRKSTELESRENKSANMVKKTRTTRDVPRNNKKGTRSNDKDDVHEGVNIQSSNSYSTSEEDNASQDSVGAATSDSKMSESGQDSNNVKTRATRGSATDPQSLYARRRRERINERLKILQNLVPNGTKVDISTMLEEAVHYVKFLQLQIKLLSSDDLWMYAPIAYNGVDVGLNQKLSMLL